MSSVWNNLSEDMIVVCTIVGINIYFNRFDHEEIQFQHILLQAYIVSFKYLLLTYKMNILKFVMARWAGEAHPAPSQKLLGSKVFRPKGASLNILCYTTRGQVE